MIKSLVASHTFNLKATALTLAILGLAGCGGTLSGAGPYKGEIESKNESYNLVEINANTIAPYMRGTPLSSNAAPWVDARRARAAVSGRMAVPALPRKSRACRTGS